MVDVGGANSDTWCALVNSLACAAVAPFAGALSDIVGRRYVALSGPIFTIIGAVILGTAHRMETAIAGCAIAGVGAGISQSVGIAGAAEMVPVRMRGRVIGNIFMGFCPLAGASAFGTCFRKPEDADFSHHVLLHVYVEMDCLDFFCNCRHRFCHPCGYLLPSSPIGLPGVGKI